MVVARHHHQHYPVENKNGGKYKMIIFAPEKRMTTFLV